MSTMMGDVTERMKLGRESIERSLEDIQERADSGRLVVAAIVAGAVVVAAGVGLLIYRRRSRRTLAERIQGALPGSVRDLPGGIRGRLKRAL